MDTEDIIVHYTQLLTDALLQKMPNVTITIDVFIDKGEDIESDELQDTL